MTSVLLEKITKSFDSRLVNDNIDFDLKSGEIHALVGANGAGKTTLINILSGIYRPDSGSILINGGIKSLSSPADAIKAGIGTVHQHIELVENMSVLENLLLGSKKHTHLQQLEKSAKRILETLEISLPLYSHASSLSVSQKQYVEIIRLLLRNSRILILDEPTAVLAPQESEKLFSILGRLLTDDPGKSILFISHKLSEITDSRVNRVSVMKKGRITFCLEGEEITPGRIIDAMVDRLPDQKHRKRTPVPGANPVLSLNNVSGKTINSVTFDVFKGEIFGICGLTGNGQSELASAISGMSDSFRGSLRLFGEELLTKGVPSRKHLGLGHIPQNRIGTGCITSMSVSKNSILTRLGENRFSRILGFLDFQAIRDYAEGLITGFRVNPPDADIQAGNLSGGNIQKLILGRETGKRAILAEYPFRGLDPEATILVRNTLVSQADMGSTIILIAEDMEMLDGICDRIAVIHRGTIQDIFDAGSRTGHEIGSLMLGEK